MGWIQWIVMDGCAPVDRWVEREAIIGIFRILVLLYYFTSRQLDVDIILKYVEN